MPHSLGYFLKLNYLFHDSPRRMHQLLEKLPRESDFDHHFETVLAEVSPANAAYYRKRYGHWNLDAYMNSLQKKGIDAIGLEDLTYPEALRQIFDPPLVLFAKGQISLLQSTQPYTAIVGTRHPSSYGEKACNWIAGTLSPTHLIVSGFASGIDTCAHQTALQKGGPTLAVFSTGLDELYPPQNNRLLSEICDKGLIISEQPPGTPVQRYRFVQRNRLISGLSQNVVICEAKEKSGALITAQFAADQGRDVWVVPGPITTPHFVGSHQLIGDGARVLVHPAELLGSQVTQPLLALMNTAQAGAVDLSPCEQVLFEVLEGGPLDFDEVVAKSHRSFAEVMVGLTQLESRELVIQHPGNRYARVGH
jgi:DNA processing protein